MKPDDAVIVAYQRTPFGRARKGTLALERPEDLALTAVKSTLDLVPNFDPNSLDDFFLGTAVPEGAQGDNVARRVAVYGGWDRLPGTTVNRFCASSLEALIMAARAIRSGDGDAYLVAGMESTSSTPPMPHNIYPGSDVQSARTEALFTSGVPWTDPRLVGQQPDVYLPMGVTAEFVAHVTGTSRADQDEWALMSQSRAARAMEEGFFAGEIATHLRQDGMEISADDCPRPLTSATDLAELKPVFRESGSVTAGNSSPLNDGASAAVVMSAKQAARLGLTPMAKILGAGASGISPEIMGLGPVGATQRVLSRLGLTVDDLDLVELNEAFAAQVVPSIRQLGLDPEKVNIHGGAIALGHPFGATGVRLAGTLARSLEKLDKTLGLVTLCVGGGQGVALVLERV